MVRFLAVALVLAAATTTLASAEDEVLRVKFEVTSLDGKKGDAGTFVMEAHSDWAPLGFARFKEMVETDFFKGVRFFRVIEGFMAQTGDVQFGDMNEGFNPGRAGTGGSKLADIPAEFTDESFERGTVGMARSQNPNSANSQFFIMFSPAPHLDGQYTVVGEVTRGMDVVDSIKRGTGRNGAVIGLPDQMVSVKVTD